MFETMHPDRLLDEYAARQYGVFSLRQTREMGFSSKMVETRVRNRAWVRLAPSVYALASAPPKWERQMAAALLTREGAVVAGRSAAYLHDFPGSRPGRPVIMVGASGNARSALASVMRTRYFSQVEKVRVQGFEATGEADTVVSLARDLDARSVERIVDEVLARKSCSIERLAEVVDDRSRVPGVSKLIPIVDERTPDAYQPPTSELERLLYPLADHPLVPPATRQLPFSFRQVHATVDLFIAAWGLILEADGRRWHTRKADMERDRLRDNEATARGLAVLRFTWKMLTESPNRCLDTLLRTGQVRSVG